MIVIPRPLPPSPTPRTVRLAVVISCHRCPYVTSEQTRGAGYALDYFCTAEAPPRAVASYVEWNSDKRADHDFPVWCPLETREVP